MNNKFLVILFCLLAVGQSCFALTPADQDYINKLNYNNSKLEIITKTRYVNVSRSYSNTDINTDTFSYEVYSNSSTNINSQSLNQSEVKEIDEWYILKGGIRKLNDLEFLQLVGDQTEFDQVKQLDDQRAGWRLGGEILIGTGLAVMLGGAALGTDSKIVTAGALSLTGGFFLSAFNQTPHHYIQPDYAQQKVDEYNLNLKQKLNLPINYN